MPQSQFIPYFPISAFAGYAAARRALLCTLVDPTLRGLVLSGPVGTGKSALMRSFGAFVRAHVDPESPFVQVPIGVGDERLIGGLDIDAALATGEKRGRTGLVAEANGGYLFVDDMPLLDNLAIAAIAGALEREEIICEREGISACSAARFVLLATALPSERDIPGWVADKVAFLIAQEEPIGPDLARMLITRLERFTRAPEAFAGEYLAREEALAEQVAAARLLHGLIRVEQPALEALAGAAVAMNVAGNRADILAAKAARAHAALRGAREIEEADIKFAIATVLAPRGENVPDNSEQSERESQAPESPADEPEPESQETEAPGGTPDERPGERDDTGEEAGGAGSGEARSDSERVYDQIDFNAELPALADFFNRSRNNAASGSMGERDQWRRGRHTRSMQRDPKGKRIAVGATLRVAAVHQESRRRAHRAAGDTERAVIIHAGDLRVKRYRERAGTLFIFCVDASGSMAINRMREAKGAVTRLLQDAYVNRDTVALIAFRGGEAELLLPPTSSVERAKRSLDVLPTGGGTPLASALLKAYALVASARRRGVERTLVILLTDGRANVPMAESAAGMIMEIRRRHVRQELDRIATSYRREGIGALVIDTKQTYGGQSEAIRLAESLGARYYFLPMIDASGLANVVKESAQ